MPRRPKRHAGSFDHLPAIYHQAVPVLLHLTAAWSRPRVPRNGAPVVYRAADRSLPPDRLQGMLTALDSLAPLSDRYDGGPWPRPLAHAWRAVNSGAPPADAARELWPHYLHRVRDWLASGQHATTRQRVQMLAAAHDRLPTALVPSAGAL